MVVGVERRSFLYRALCLVGEQVRLEPMRMELYLRVRAWEVGRIAGGATVEIVD